MFDEEDYRGMPSFTDEQHEDQQMHAQNNDYRFIVGVLQEAEKSAGMIDRDGDLNDEEQRKLNQMDTWQLALMYKVRWGTELQDNPPVSRKIARDKVHKWLKQFTPEELELVYLEQAYQVQISKQKAKDDEQANQRTWQLDYELQDFILHLVHEAFRVRFTTFTPLTEKGRL